MNKQIQQPDYTAKPRALQLVMPLNLELQLPKDSELRLLIEITEEMDYRELEATYERRESAGEASAKQLFQLVICGFMNGHYTLRELREAYRYDLRMIYLLHGKKVPSHECFGNFIRKHLAGDVCENLFYQLIREPVRCLLYKRTENPKHVKGVGVSRRLFYPCCARRFLL